MQLSVEVECGAGVTPPFLGPPMGPALMTPGGSTGPAVVPASAASVRPSLIPAPGASLEPPLMPTASLPAAHNLVMLRLLGPGLWPFSGRQVRCNWSRCNARWFSHVDPQAVGVVVFLNFCVSSADAADMFCEYIAGGTSAECGFHNPECNIWSE